MFSKDNTEAARKKFFAQFKEKTGDDVCSVEFATMEASRRVFTLFGLEPATGQNELAGLLVFCTASLYFYVFPTANIFRLAMQRMAGDTENKEQCFCLSSLEDAKILFGAKKGLRFLFPKRSRTVHVGARHNGDYAEFSLCFTKDASPLIEPLKTLLSCRNSDA